MPKETRHEFKFVTKGSFYQQFKCWVLCHALGFKTAYPSRWINNIYFDSYGLDSYEDNLSGASTRIKLRYRWYGSLTNSQTGNLEIKCKKNLFGWKIRYPIENLPSLNLSVWKEIRKAMKLQLDPGARIHFESRPQAVLVNQYLRDYFISLDGKVMLNLDTKQCVMDQRGFQGPNLRTQVNMPDTVIVEVKSDPKDLERVVHLMQGFPLRWSRHSKYIAGLNSIRNV